MNQSERHIKQCGKAGVLIFDPLSDSGVWTGHEGHIFIADGKQTQIK
jgi:hypothetical protein